MSTTEDLTKRVSISVGEAAELMGVSSSHAYELASEGRLPGMYRPRDRKRGRILVHVPTLLAGIEAMANTFAPGSAVSAAPASADASASGTPGATS